MRPFARRSVVTLLVLAATASGGEIRGQEETTGRTYQRSRHSEYYPGVPVRRSANYRQQRLQQPPGNRQYGHYLARPRAKQQIAAGSFQRPYPYHLDYYRKQYGGSYEPYFGNLYGPPNVVLAPGYGYGAGGLGYGYGASVGVCPHCGQPWPHAATTAPTVVTPSGPTIP